MSFFRPFTLDDPFFHPFLTVATAPTYAQPQARQAALGGGNREVTPTSDGHDVASARSTSAGEREDHNDPVRNFNSSFWAHPLIREVIGSNAANQLAQRAASGATSHHSNSSLSHWLNYFSPRLDLHEEPGRYKLSVELAGVPRENVHLDVDEKIRRLTISGSVRSEYDSRTSKDTTSSVSNGKTKDGEAKDKDNDAEVSTTTSAKSTTTPPSPTSLSGSSNQGRPIISERTYGSFSRSLILPETVDLGKIKANFKDGILNVEIPKKKDEVARVRRVTVEDGGEE